jgi:hypothetical protein
MKKTKSAKVAEHFLKYPNAVPKDVGAKFKMAMPQVYGVRKRVLSGSMLGEIVNPQITDAVTQTARDVQVGGQHYKAMSIQPWDVVDTWDKDQQIGYYRGGALKYIMRMGSKDQSATEIAKGKHYMQKLLEVLG